MGLGLFLAKLVHWSRPPLTPVGLRDYVTDVLVSSHADVLFVVAVGLVASLLLRLAAGRPRLTRALGTSLAAFGALAIVYAVASVQIFAFLRSPLTYPLLYLAGDMNSMRSSIGSFLTPGLLAAFLLAPLVYLVAVRATRGLVLFPSWPRRVAGLLLLAVWLLFARVTLAGPWGDRDDHLIARSPHFEIVASCLYELGGGHAERFDESFTPADLADFEAPAPRLLARPPFPRTGASPRNVLLIVMESTGARYLSLYGSRYPTTPRLAAEAKHALVFDRFYCHVGMTANSLTAISLSIFPYMTWREYTVEYPHFPGETLANLFHARGYRTAFIESGDLAYVNQREFLENRGFDKVADFADLGGNALSSWGGDDRLLPEGILRFIDEAPQQPFYAVAWTAESHHPYESSPDHVPIDFFAGGPLPPDDYDFGRYLNTLNSVDQQLGRIFDGLRERGLADSTLVVVTGDHGEAFGAPHRTWGHGARLYQEGIRVPLMLWNPRLFPEGRRVATIGGHVDINPTVAHLLGVPPAPSWEGKSLFDPGRAPRAYFYAANDDYLLGVRENDWKYIYNVTRGRNELYDLARDPDEQTNVALQNAELCLRLRRRLAAWRDYAGRQLARLRPPRV
jgi:arylsulfatase A-like enzyme